MLALKILSSNNPPELELRMWKKVIRSVLGETPYKTLESIVMRELAKEPKKDVLASASSRVD